MMKELMKRQSGRLRRRLVITALIALLLAGYAGWALERDLPALRPSTAGANYSVKTGQAALSWPAAGQSAVGIVGSDTLVSSPAQKPVPTASTAKILTVLAVLQKKPLANGQTGPTITLTANDVAIYNNYVARDGSVVPVNAGEQISEYQMLQAIMLPSANNMADSLAIWAFGSLPKYAAYANMYAKQHGLTGTHVGSDASGLSADTVSTAEDLTRLGELAMQHPVLSAIVGQSTASGIPVAGTVKNVNHLLGTDGIIGVKTGNSDQAGGAYVAAARKNILGRDITIVTAVAGAPDLFSAMKTSLPLIDSAAANFQSIIVMPAGSVVGQYKLPWGGTLPVSVSRDLVVNVWKGRSVPLASHLKSVDPVNPPSSVGELAVADPTVGHESVPLVLKAAIPEPSAWWRLTHPLR